MKIVRFLPALTLCLGGCGMLFHFIAMDDYRKPFAAGDVGSRQTIEFKVPTERFVEIYLLFRNYKQLYLDGKEVSVLGDGGYDPVTYKRFNNGVPIPLSVELRELDSGGVILSKIIQEEEYDGAYKKITGASLPRGTYVVSVVSLQNVPAIQGMPIDLDVHAPSRK